MKTVFTSQEECEIVHKSCEEKEPFWLGPCEEGFEPVGNFMCSFRCPEGFEEDGDFCRPEILENFDFTFEDLA